MFFAILFNLCHVHKSAKENQQGSFSKRATERNALCIKQYPSPLQQSLMTWQWYRNLRQNKNPFNMLQNQSLQLYLERVPKVLKLTLCLMYQKQNIKAAERLNGAQTLQYSTNILPVGRWSSSGEGSSSVLTTKHL